MLTSRNKLRPDAAIRLYESIVRPTFTYGCQAWWEGQPAIESRLNVLQNKFLRIITGCYATTRVPLLHHFTGVPPIQVWMNYLTDKFVTQKTNAHFLHPTRALLPGALDRPLASNPVLQQVAAAQFDLPTELLPDLDPDFMQTMHVRVPPWAPPFHNRSIIFRETFDPESPYSHIKSFIKDCARCDIAPLVAELSPSSGPDADNSWSLLQIGIIVSQTFSIRPLACFKIAAQEASRPVIAAGALLSYLDDPDFPLVDLPHYGLFVTNLLLANCAGLLPSRRKLPSPPRAYAYREQRASTKRLFITALSKPSDSARIHPARALRPLKAFRRTPPVGFPHRYETPRITPTLAWRNTNSKGRAILALSRSSLDIPLSHPSHAFGAHAKVVFPASLGSLAGHLAATAPALPTTTVSTQSSSLWSVRAEPTAATPPMLPSIVLSGPSGQLTLNFSGRRPTPPAPSATIFKYGSPASTDPASSPGGGSPNTFVERLDRLPPGFEWTSIPVIPSTKHIREKLLLLAVKRGPALSNFELLDILEEDPYTNDTIYHAAHSDYIRLRRLYYEFFDPRQQEALLRYCSDLTPPPYPGPAARGYLF
ncbi:hypothetical protein BOTBODRAFT_172763 [Botryobasidium botryosum FD-172 SS1]|uniref:Uncharacterized protein n=1 Tax=Botryobasidium botryosum (strain FD-172 SS1) TaxID=930990 RepID=A0A067MLK7_BOTB1|nr:hypothetical protein BOTBODRAFT_172763 [Botryobasidium botryosum FD-172 SS1]